MRALVAIGLAAGALHHPPGWAAFLAPFSALGVDSELGHRLVGAVLGGAVVALVGPVALAGRRAGLVAATLGALHPTLVAADGSLMSETLSSSPSPGSG